MTHPPDPPRHGQAPHPSETGAHQQQGGKHPDDDMRAMAGTIIGHHTQPTADAAPTRAFPRSAMVGLATSSIAGAVLGALFAGLTRAGSAIALPRAEQLQSIGDITYYVLWILTGLAAGIALGGTTALLAAPLAKPGARTPTR